jgi:hypothetical protein
MFVTNLIDFGTILTGILFVAGPFLIVGILISNIIQQFVSQERMLALYGRGFWRNYLVSIVAGFLFPVCECGIVPIARSLVKNSGTSLKLINPGPAISMSAISGIFCCLISSTIISATTRGFFPRDFDAAMAILVE